MDASPIRASGAGAAPIAARPKRAPAPSRRPLIAVGLVGLAAGAGAALLLRRVVRPRPEPAMAAAQGLAAGGAVLALSVALDSGLEHYRGSFKNRAMVAAPTVATATLAATIAAALRPGATTRPQRLVFAAALATGAAGLGFHLYDVGKRQGGFSLQNLFYAAPLGAPAALALAGLYGLAGARLAAGRREEARLLAPLVAISIAGTAGEAALLHFRGAFQNPVMVAPVLVPPLAAGAIALAAVRPGAIPAARTLLGATAALGLAGPLFHAYGIHRNMGGWRNWSQMILQGPPLPAPPAFFGTAIAGLGLLPLLEGKRR